MPSSHPSLEIETKDGVAHVWMNRPIVHNAFDEVFIDELTRAFGELEHDAAVHVVVLGGRGKSFCAGADLKWMERAAAFTLEENLRDARALATMLRALNQLSKPTIARVHGAALGGGAGLVAACDIAIASKAAVFGMTEVRYGLIPATIGPYVLGAIGQRGARRYFLTAERFGADEASAIGLVHEVCDPESLDERVGAVVQTLRLGGPKAQAAAKKLIRTLGQTPVADWAIEHTAREIAELRATSEAKEGIAAFLGKRKPAWNPPPDKSS